MDNIFSEKFMKANSSENYLLHMITKLLISKVVSPHPITQLVTV